MVGMSHAAYVGPVRTDALFSYPGRGSGQRRELGVYRGSTGHNNNKPAHCAIGDTT